jgi:UPF0271 protein
MLSVDLNCDLGEGMPHDADLMPLISSANIACGGHAGDDDIMRRTVELALKYNVAIGAHPSYPDKENFGRKDLIDVSIRAADLAEILLDQVNRLENICAEFGANLHHIKPHGALYNRAAWDGLVSSHICVSLLAIDPKLFLYGLSGSKMKVAAESVNIKFVSEVFADRSYQDDGSLTPRQEVNSLIENDEQALQQSLQMIKEGYVTSFSGKKIAIEAQTICLHGDGPHALSFARRIREIFEKEGIQVQAP